MSATPNDPRRFLAGGGEMGEHIRSYDWTATPLGPLESWSPALRMMVRFLLANRFPLLLWWGPEYVSIYNDAYRPILGTKHPRALGQPVRECWKEIWHILQPLIDTPFHGGPPTWNDDIPLEINRHGFVEETHFTIAYSPVPDETVPSGIGGVLATVHEITEKVIGERRVVALRDLGAQVGEAKTAEDACAIAARTLAQHDKDVPFVLLYLIDGDGTSASLAGAAGVEVDGDLSPRTVDLCEMHDDGWPFTLARESGTMQLVEWLSERFGAVPRGPWSDPPDTAVVVPIPSNRAHEPAGLMVAGLSARSCWDESYRGFIELLTTQIATAVANARAYEEEKKRAEALAELDRAKTTFFSNVSHEFRTPLTLILGPLEDALSEAMERWQRDRLLMLQRNGLRLQKLVNTLLDFSRIEAGRIQASYAPTDLAQLTAELASAFRSAVEKAGMRLTVDCPPLDESIYVDRDMYEKVVLNLLSNAFKFTLEGDIEVTLRDAGTSVELSVRDTGGGIAEDHLPHVFERFQRIEGARARTHEGTGIGLALVQELVKLHGGAVSVRSVVGKGSTFTVSIPKGTAHLPADRIGTHSRLASTALAAGHYVEEALRWLPDAARVPGAADSTLMADVSPAAARADGRPRIVWADDNADMRDYVGRLLGRLHDVEAVADGEAALAAAQRQRPDLVLADVMMPQLDGFGLVKALRADDRTRTIPVILLSARAGEEARVEGMQAGADDYLVKPFGARELLARVQAHLAMARVRREAAEALQRSEEVTAADLEAMRRLHDVGVRCARPGTDHDECLKDIVDTAIAITGADQGNIQLLDARSGLLRIVAHRGFERPFLDHFAAVGGEHAAACGASMRSGERVVVEDVCRSELFAGQSSQAVMLEAGVRAVQSTPLLSSAGNVLGMISTHFREPHRPEERELRLMDLLARHVADYLERRQADVVLRESEQRFRTLFEAMEEGYCVIEMVFDERDDPVDYRFLEVNPAFEKQTGIKDAKGRLMREIAPEHEQHWFEIYGEIARSGETRRFENPAAALGRYYDVCAFRVGPPELRRVGIVFNDITERKKSEEAIRRTKEALLEADRRKDEFLATLAHELRNPLAPIRNCLHLLGMTDGAAAARVHEMMERQVNHLVRLVDDLMEVSRITRGKVALRKEPSELAAIVRSALETSAPLIDAARHQLVVDLPADPLVLNADPVRLSQVITNLLNNAAKYTEPGGHIWLTARCDGADAVLSVRDDGMGIPADMLPKVFDLFTQGDRTYSRAQGGLGIGLTLVRSLVEMHGGTVEARSDGNGSEFLVRLPLSGALPVATDHKPGIGRANGSVSGRILVVDDNRDAAESLGILLSSLGADVSVVHDGSAALEALRTCRPSVLLLDIGMPGMDGYEVARRVRQEPDGRDVTLIALSGWGQEEDRRRSREAGIDLHLVKPVDFRVLERLVAGLGADWQRQPTEG